MKRNFLKYVGSAVFTVAMTLTCHAQFIQNTGLQLSNTSNVVTNGDWVNSAGSVILNNGTISISESFSNSGSFDPASTGGFILNNATDLNFFAATTARMGFFVKLGAGNAVITGNIAVRDSIHLKQGLLVLLSPGDSITALGGAIVTGTPTSYVEGVFAHSGSGDFYFPLGKDGKFMPLTIYKAKASHASASIIPIPVGATAGPGVDSLINFPYAWKVNEKVASDTAAYVEVKYPNTLPTVVNPIVVRDKGGSVFASMGSRFSENTSGYVTVRSYSRGLKGVFTVAGGFPIDRKTDSLALVALYDATGGGSWTTKTNWKTGQLETWFGVTITGQTITGVNLPNNNLAGDVPDPLVDILGLEVINLSNNKLTSIPDFNGNPEIQTLDVSGNRLMFGSLEPNATVPGLTYSNQALIGSPVEDLLPVGSPYTFEINAGGEVSAYQWTRNGVEVPGATLPLYDIQFLDRSNMGDYELTVTNPLLPALTLKSETQQVLAYADLSGTLYASPSVAASAGQMTLLRITPSAYDTIAVNDISASGNFTFEKVVLDDYKLLGFADTLVHEISLPTYYKNTIFWEEADTLFVETNIPDLTIVSNNKPSAPSGRGVIQGYLEEDDGTGRTKETQKPKRVGGAGVSVRRVENTGRGKEEILTLVAYVFTNDDGEFSIANLPEAEYRLNIQYPGYPMDPNSFVTIPIGGGLQSLVQVAANVAEGKIKVEKLNITNIYATENYSAEVFPNPAVDFIQLRFGKESSGRKAVVMDLNGKKLVEDNVGSKEARISVETFRSGIYLMHIIENGVIVKTVKIGID